MFIYTLYNWTVPLRIRKIICDLTPRYLYATRWGKMAEYRSKNREFAHQYGEELEFISRNKKIGVFNYAFTKGYRPEDVMVYKDVESGLFYTLSDGKKLFWPRGYSRQQIKICFNSILMEQDERSPHRYFSEYFNPGGGIFIDLGAAEGMISLKLIEKMDKIILFECDLKWIEALKHTFAPWKDKIEIINKYIGNRCDGDSITLDKFLEDRFHKAARIYIKCDIEGEETGFLTGGEKSFRKYNISCAICSYHKEADESWIEAFAERISYGLRKGEGYMFPPLDGKSAAFPFFRKGVCWLYNKL